MLQEGSLINKKQAKKKMKKDFKKRGLSYFMKQPLRNYCNGVVKTLSDTSMQQKVYRGVRMMSPYDMELITSHPELRKESLLQEQIKDVTLNSEKPAFSTKTLYRINGGREDE